MKKLTTFTLAFFFAAACMGQIFAEEARNALLIANNQYETPNYAKKLKEAAASPFEEKNLLFSNLDKPVNEAEALAAVLKKLGFSVTVVDNADEDAMLKALKNFKTKTKKDSGIAFFHYGGHAVQIDGVNYLIPAKNDVVSEEQVKRHGINLEAITGSMKGSSNIVVLDSCRVIPYKTSGSRGGGGETRGLAAVPSKVNSIVIYSAASGEPAQDGVFTPILTRNLLKKESLQKIIIDVRNEVKLKTNNTQIPAEYSKLSSLIYLAGMDAGNASQALAMTPKQHAPPPPVYTADVPEGMVAVQPDGPIVGQAVDYELPGSEEWRKGVFVSGRSVELSPYCIGEVEVTYGQWKEVYRWAKNNGYSFVNSGDGKGDSYPVTNVSWRDCIVWCNAYTEKYYGSTSECVYKSGKGKYARVLKDSTQKAEVDNAYFDRSKKGFRLPTEAEWEYAARYQKNNDNGNAAQYGSSWLTKLNSASGTYAYWKNEGATGEVAWFEGNSGKTTHPVGQKEGNALGLYDMSGNVWEWCFDWYNENAAADGGKYKRNGVVQDPCGSPSGSYRVLRGGSWLFDAQYCAVGGRSGFTPDYSLGFLGFRLACRP